MNKEKLHGVMKGYFYLGTYFLLPEGYADEASFLQYARQAEAPLNMKAVILREDSEVGHDPYELGVCIAPYFISDYLNAPEELIIEYPGEIYPAQVELLTQQEYNDRLREQVMSHCDGCRGFGGLNENDSSLSGHFEEISLDGFCPYRWETRNSPRNFNNELYDFGSAWARFGYREYSADDVLEEIKYSLKLSYTSGMILDEGDMRTLILYSKKPTVIQTVLTDMLAKCMEEYWDERYRIRLNGRAETDEASVMALISPKKIASTRKELSKYGVKIAVLEYDKQGDDSVRLFLSGMCIENMDWILHTEPGKTICLLPGEYSVMRLRCASPMLEIYETVVTLYDALKTVQYKVSFNMQEIVQDAVLLEEVKEKPLSKKLLKAQEGKVLNRDQVEQLFAYVSGRLGKTGCDHTLRFTELWLKETLPSEAFVAAIEEIQNMGGYCDCEVLMNCYEEYELM